MAFRTNAEKVQLTLMSDYGPLTDGTLPDLTPFMEEANNLTTQVFNLAIQYRQITLDATTLELVERRLAAHFYALSDQPLASKSTGRASASFQGQTTLGIMGTKYGQAAISADFTRVLAAIDKGAFAYTSWLGKRPSEQIPWIENN